MEINVSDMLLLVIISFLMIYIFLQILIAIRLNLLTRYLFDIVIELKSLSLKDKILSHEKVFKNCSVCKHRLPYFNFKKQTNDALYYRCRLTKEKVEPEFYCSYFEFDRQQKGA